MALDASIILGGRAPQLDDPLTVRAKQATLADLMGRQQMQQMQIESAQRERQDAQTLADLYRESAGDMTKIPGLLAQRGQGARIPAFQQQQATISKAEADARTAQLKAAQERLKMTGSRLSSLLANPAVTHDDVIGAITGLVQDGIVDQAHGARMVQGLPGDPGRLRQMLIAQGMELMGENERINLALGKTELVDQGGQRQAMTTNQLTGQVTPGQSFAKTATPGELLSAETQRRGQNMVDARSRDTLRVQQGATNAEMGGPQQSQLTAQFGKPAPGFRWKTDGSLEAIPGGPADRKNTDAGIREARQRDASMAQADRVVAKVDQALEKVGLLTAGPGAILSSIPGTPARNLDSTLQTIKANLGFAELQAMRDASPTGGALGAIAVQELMALQATVASLDQGQSPEQLRKSLGDIRKHYTAWKNAVQKAGGGSETVTPTGGGLSPQEQAELEELRSRFGKGK